MSKSVTKFLRAVALFGAGLSALAVQAGSSSLNLVVTVIRSSGACGASVAGGAVSVSCGRYASLPLLPPVSGVAMAGQQGFAGGTFGFAALPFVGGGFVSGGGATGGGVGRKQPDTPSGESSPQQLAFDDGATASDESGLRQVGVLPAWATGNTPMAVFSGGANLSSWRVVSNDNAQRVELTISW